MLDFNVLSAFIFVFLIYGMINNYTHHLSWTRFLRMRGRSKQAGLRYSLQLWTVIHGIKVIWTITIQYLKHSNILFKRWCHCHHRKPYSSLTLNTIPPHVGPFKTSRFVGLFAILDTYSATIKADMYCSRPILKTLGKWFDRWGRCLINVWILYFE